MSLALAAWLDCLVEHGLLQACRTNVTSRKSELLETNGHKSLIRSKFRLERGLIERNQLIDGLSRI
jgi:hypothetical protein